MEIPKDELRLIEQYGAKPVDAGQLFTFSVVLCDNEVDRDNERFTLGALEKLKDLFLGKSGIFDHQAKAATQWARIYQTQIVADPGKKTTAGETYHALRAKAYMVRHQKNEALIAEISAGIKKEVSVGCSVARRICSLCHSEVGKNSCGHQKGEKIGGQTVSYLLDEPTDAYEWSFVVVPAQRAAGVVKTFGGGKEMDKDMEKEMGAKMEINKLWAQGALNLDEEQTEKLKTYVGNLQEEAAFGKAYREELIQSVLVGALKHCPTMDGEVLKKMGEKMAVDELTELSKLFAFGNRPKIQFAPGDERENENDAYAI